MDLYVEADKHVTKFSEVIRELADANQLMDEDQLIDFIDDWSAAVYENAKDQWQVALHCRFSEDKDHVASWDTALEFHDVEDGIDALMTSCAKWFVRDVLMQQFGGYEIVAIFLQRLAMKSRMAI